MKLTVSHDDRKLTKWERDELEISLYPILLNREIRCAACGQDLEEHDVHVDLYDHDGGELLVADMPKMWVSVHCACDYDTSLNKLKRRK